MALGTITPQKANAAGTTQQGSHGDLKFTVTNVVGDSSYPTGGSVLTAGQLGLSTVIAGFAQITASAGGANSVSVGADLLPQANGSAKLICFASASTSPVQVQESANTQNLSSLTFQVFAWGY